MASSPSAETALWALTWEFLSAHRSQEAPLGNFWRQLLPKKLPENNVAGTPFIPGL